MSHRGPAFAWCMPPLLLDRGLHVTVSHPAAAAPCKGPTPTHCGTVPDRQDRPPATVSQPNSSIAIPLYTLLFCWHSSLLPADKSSQFNKQARQQARSTTTLYHKAMARRDALLVVHQLHRLVRMDSCPVRCSQSNSMVRM